MGGSLAPRRWACGFALAASLVAGTRLPGTAQTVPTIDPASVRLDNTTNLTFQFQADDFGPAGFVIELTSGSAASPSWSDASPGTITALAPGLFQATLPTPGTSPSFYRIRTSNPPPPQLFINEVMSDNTSTLTDQAGLFHDWIEIYNPADVAVDLTDFALTDDSLAPGKWRFPTVLIQPQSYLVVFASDLNLVDPSQPLHTNFKLAAGGERLLLSDSALQLIDEFQIPALAVDQAVGRVPDGSGSLQLLSQADTTPGMANPILTTDPILQAPTLLPDGGFFADPVTVEVVAAEPTHTIHYTVDGSEPSSLSPTLDAPLTLSQTTVLRVLARHPRGHLSDPVSRTFFIGVDHQLPIISLATSPTNMAFRDGYLYGMGSSVLSSQDRVLQNYPYSGSNAWKDREVEVALELFETNHITALRQQAGMKIFGGWGSRGYPQKSLALFARRIYGDGKFNHRLFPEQNLNEFESFVLRNSGNDNQSTHQTPPRPPITEFGTTRPYGSYFVNGTFTLLRDAFLQQLLDGTSLDRQAYRPAVVYINGDYWGIYNIREKTSADYVSAHNHVAPDQMDLIEGYGKVNAGSSTTYTAMRSYIANQDMANPANYAFVQEHYLDIANFIDYHLAVIYFQNFDIGNIKCWRPSAPRGRFRWIVYDQDYGFGLWPAAIYEPAMARDYGDYRNMFDFYTAGTGTSVSWPNGGGNTLLLRRLLDNPDFRNRFIQRCADLLNTTFHPDRVQQTLATMAEVIRPEIPAHLERWNWTSITARDFGLPHQSEFAPFTQDTWEQNLAVLSDFGATRPDKLRQDCIDHFQLTGDLGTLQLEVDPPGAGLIQLNSITPTNLPWTGTYFVDVPNSLQAIPTPGYRFVSWSTPNSTSTAFTLSNSIQANTTNTFIAHFEPAPANPTTPPELIITEIQYHPADNADSGDWITLHNPGPNPVHLTGWIFRDNEDHHAFLLPDTTLEGGSSLVLCEEEDRFRIYHDAALPVAGSFQFGLNNSGDTLRLYRPDGTLALSITYDDVAPWPPEADGTGRTLQLIDPQADPTLPQSWTASP
ncbi:MAG: hypothetical protein RI897_3679 [Verrucomicrobiota bacterium]